MKSIYVVLLLVLFGLLLGQGDAFQLINFTFILFMILVFFGVFVLVGAIAKENTTVKSGMKVIASLLIIFISMFVGCGIKQGLNDYRAERIVKKVELYKRKHRLYPKDLKEIGLEGYAQKYNYSVDSSRHTFRLRYSVDGWMGNEYFSEDQEWVMSD